MLCLIQAWDGVTKLPNYTDSLASVIQSRTQLGTICFWTGPNFHSSLSLCQLVSIPTSSLLEKRSSVTSSASLWWRQQNIIKSHFHQSSNVEKTCFFFPSGIMTLNHNAPDLQWKIMLSATFTTREKSAERIIPPKRYLYNIIYLQK